MHYLDARCEMQSKFFQSNFASEADIISYLAAMRAKYFRFITLRSTFLILLLNSGEMQTQRTIFRFGYILNISGISYGGRSRDVKCMKGKKSEMITVWVPGFQPQCSTEYVTECNEVEKAGKTL